MAQLKCRRCKVTKDSDQYTPSQQRQGGNRWCRSCVAEYNREANKKRPPRRRADMTPEQIELRRAHDRARSKTRMADYYFKYRYGLTLVEINEMAERQGNVCAICGDRETRLDHRTKEVRRLSVDHDHRTGRVRELLCARCNKVLGAVNDDPLVLVLMMDYLKKHSECHPDTVASNDRLA